MRTIVLACLVGCAPEPDAKPCEVLAVEVDDDPGAWPADAAGAPMVSAPRFVIPGDDLPVTPHASNNNVSMMIAGGRTFLAWRSAPTHFASAETEMHVVSSETGTAPWTFEATFALGTDLREPALFVQDGVLAMTFFEAGANPFGFDPRAVWRASRCSAGDWDLEPISEGEKVPWDVKTRDGRTLRTAYSGDHYGDGLLSVHLEETTDAGLTWTPIGLDPVSEGGDSEVAFEIAADGTLWAVTRNEDGDATGYGSKVCSAPAADWSDWTCSEVSDPERYDSPEMIRHGGEIYVLARRDVGGPFGPEGGLLQYSTRPKRSALYRLDTDARQVVWLQDLPGVGDTAFVSARRTGAHSWTFANYTSPLDAPDVSWLTAQASERGTGIYLADLTFED